MLDGQVDRLLAAIAGNAPAFHAARLADTRAYYSALSVSEHLALTRGLGSAPYTHYHRFRVLELVLTVARLARQLPKRRRLRLVECSPSPPFARLLRQRLPGLLDHHVLHHPNDRVAGEADAPARPSRVPYDFNAIGREPLPLPSDDGTATLICAAEIVEHLTVDLCAFIAAFRERGFADAYLLITTPNAQSRWRLRMLLRGLSPQQRFKADKLATGAHHFREYTLQEIVAAVRDAGAVPISTAYSVAMPGPGSEGTERDYLSAVEGLAGPDAEVLPQIMGWNGTVTLARLSDAPST